MFNFFKKIPTKIEEPVDTITNSVPLVSITYNINNNLETSVDILMDDYGAESINGMCKLLDTLSNNRFYIETVDMLKQGLLSDNQPEVLLTILTHISQQARYNMTQSHKDSTNDEPCIKPSDML